MDNAAIGVGAIGFWLFIAAVVVGGMWTAVREKQIQQETLMRLIESGREIDQELMDKLFGKEKNTGQDLKIAGVIVIFGGFGLALLGWFLSMLNAKALLPLLGVAALAVLVGIGLLVASKIAARSADDPGNQPQSY